MPKLISRRTIGLSGAAVLVAGALTLTGVGGAGAQDAPQGPPDCDGEIVLQEVLGDVGFGTQGGQTRIYSDVDRISTRDFGISTPLPPGTWEVQAVSYDGYPERPTVFPQPFEQWFVEFYSAGGELLAVSGTTPDLEDEVLEASFKGSVGQITLSETATNVRIVHAFADNDDVPTPNSVRPVCQGFTLVEPATTTTTTTTTTTVPETTTTPPPTTTEPPDGSATTTTTTTVPTEVLPETEVAQPAQPTPAQPTFTG